MKLSKLMEGISPVEGSLGELDIGDVTSDSRKAGKGTVFVCLRGEKADGHDFAEKAALAGCEVIVAEHETGAPAAHIIVENTRRAYALLCANLFGNPSKRLRLIGVTGTNGKTTTAFLIKGILEYNGHKSGLIGTIQNMAGDEVLPSRFTTPEPHELQQTLLKIADAGCKYTVMEVSSHALDQERVAGLHFAAGVFTNLTQDHLDYHKTMENYLKAKLKLFQMSDCAVVNLDDGQANRVLEAAAGKKVTYSAKNMDSDYTARNVRLRPDGIDYELVGMGVIGRVSAHIPGGFSVYNTLAAAACTLTLGLPFSGVLSALGNLSGVKGRIEVVPTGRDFTVIIDYAHTPDALEKILRAIRGFARARIIALFGCGGDRDRTKRPLMGGVVSRGADFCVVTSDNPRTEDPGKIIEDILPGMEGGAPYRVIGNRREAIAWALSEAKPGDIVLLAGKGHEDYQIIGTEKHHFDEREVVAEALKNLPPRRAD